MKSSVNRCKSLVSLSIFFRCVWLDLCGISVYVAAFLLPYLIFCAVCITGIHLVIIVHAAFIVWLLSILEEIYTNKATGKYFITYEQKKNGKKTENAYIFLRIFAFNFLPKKNNKAFILQLELNSRVTHSCHSYHRLIIITSVRKSNINVIFCNSTTGTCVVGRWLSNFAHRFDWTQKEQQIQRITHTQTSHYY